MQIIKKNLKIGEVTVKPESPEDLWYLSQLVHDGDSVRGKTERKIKIGESDQKQAIVKKTVYLIIDVEKVEFHKHSDVLRVSGKVTEGPEDVPNGSYHTINVEPGVVVTIKKDGWLSFQLDKLKEAVESVKQAVIIVVFDREEAIFALLKGSGQEILTKLKGDVSKKRLDTGKKKNFYVEIVKLLEDYNKRLKPNHIIAASPSFWKEYLNKEIPDDLKKKVTLASCSEVSEGAISEVLKRPEVFKVFESDRAAKELKLIDLLLHSISKDEACYGIKECDEKIEMGAVKEFLASYEFLNKARREGKHKKVERLLKLAEKRGGKVHILSSSDAEKKLIGLGGVAGILRWKS